MLSSSSPDEQGNSELQEQLQTQPEPAKDCVYKTKLIQFLGRTLPIVLQNDNGPCPLLAICNVLLLRNHLNLSPETTDVSQEKLLSLVAERLIDSNSNVDNKDAGYVKNQQQNIADAIDLLPRLATGIDVNIKFRRIDDFEFTRECAIFDLLDIPLYHGWIVDTQDQDTADAIGSKSYNALMGELVFLETKNMDDQQRDLPAEDSVDFVAATTATLGVPSPSLSRAMSFDDSPHSASEKEGLRKGDIEEEAELLRALKLSESDDKNSVSCPTGTNNLNVGSVSVNFNENISSKTTVNVISMFKLDTSSSADGDNSCPRELSLIDGCTGACAKIDEHAIPTGEFDLSFKTNEVKNLDHSTPSEYKLSFDSNNKADQSSTDQSVYIGSETSLPTLKSAMPSVDSHADVAGAGDKVCDESTSESTIKGSDSMEGGHTTSDAACPQKPHTNSDSSSGRPPYNNDPEKLTSNVDGGEPIYEGEECVLEAVAPAFENCEPVYEGEVVLAEQNDKSTSPASDTTPKDDISPQHGELIRNFLKNTANQLTFYGLFCLQEGLKERELCVFFRNNHFSTMFKFDRELYLLATDQGYINQPDLVWEKLNEVNGDTLFMTGNFKEFKVESDANHTWDENNAVASTADYLASIDSAAQSGGDINNDLQLAIALQQQEFEQQPQRHSSQQPATTGSSRLITGPQVARSSGRQPPSSFKPETKSKDKDRCNVM